MNSSQDKIYTYFERDPELKVLFIFNNPFLKAELETCHWEPGFRYIVFNGQWFTIKYMLDNDWADDKVVLYFNQTSPIQSKSLQASFPLMDVLTANMEYHQQDYAAFMQQYGLPDNMATFVERNIMQLQSEKMMRMLEAYYQDDSINEDIAVRAFLASYMGMSRVLEWDDIIIRVLLSGRTSEQNKQADFFRRVQGSKLIRDALDAKLRSIFDVSFDMNTVSKVDRLVQVLKYNAIVQNLAPVNADNYRQNRISDSLALQQMNRILEMTMSQPKSAAAMMEVMQELGADIRDEDIIQWYGTDANYYFIPDGLCIPILRTLMENRLVEEPESMIERLEELMIKHSENGELGIVMDYDLLVARYYERVKAFGTLTLNSPDEYIQSYQSDFFLIDQYYRLATEAYYKIQPTCVLYDAIQKTKQRLDQDYAKLANRFNLEWTRCIGESAGIKSIHLLRQEDFYEQEIKPFQNKVVVIVSDALRYEVAQELIGELAKSKHVAKLNAAIAMLPTETKFCKPALLPHKSLTLYGTDGDQNMAVDHKILGTTQERSEHLSGYRDGALCVQFDEIAKFNKDINKDIFKRPVVYIFHDAIDHTGHNENAQETVEACRKAIADIAKMVRYLHDNPCNVTNVYVTSDHGFLFNDIVFAEKDKQQVKEDNLEKTSRYYLTTSKDVISGVVKYPLSEVSGIEADNVYVAVPDGTNRFAAPSGGYMFTHGGASLQEMVIPIVTSHYERSDNKLPVGVMLLDRNLSIQASRLRFKLVQTEAVSMNMKERVITVALYHNDKPVTQVKTVTLDKTDQLLDSRKMTVDLTLTSNVNAKVLQLKVFDIDDELNPLIKENVTNNTLIENDFDF